MKKFLKKIFKLNKKQGTESPVKQDPVSTPEKPAPKPMCLVRVYHNRVCYDNRGIKTEANFVREVWMPCDEIPADGTYTDCGGYGYDKRTYKILL